VSLRDILNNFIRAVIKEAERNPEFKAALNDALGISPGKPKPKQPKKGASSEPAGSGDVKRGKNRRPPAAFDPVQKVRDGEIVLRDALKNLSLDQLRDIVAEYGMDKRAMRWVKPERVIDLIVEMSIARASKGDTFFKPGE